MALIPQVPPVTVSGAVALACGSMYWHGTCVRVGEITYTVTLQQGMRLWRELRIYVELIIPLQLFYLKIRVTINQIHSSESGKCLFGNEEFTLFSQAGTCC